MSIIRIFKFLHFSLEININEKQDRGNKSYRLPSESQNFPRSRQNFYKLQPHPGLIKNPTDAQIVVNNPKKNIISSNSILQYMEQIYTLVMIVEKDSKVVFFALPPANILILSKWENVMKFNLNYKFI